MSEDQTNINPRQPSELSQLIALVQELKERVELQHYDTRPVWELVSSEISQIRIAQEETNNRVEDLNGKVEELNGKVEDVRQELASFRADTNHNHKLLDRTVREAFGDIGELRGRMSILPGSVPRAVASVASLTSHARYRSRY
jgi:predicted RNase H-like nuclease (RuvC/YqgF family)